MEKITIMNADPQEAGIITKVVEKDGKPVREITGQYFKVPDLSCVSDGYHTIQELYEHRVALFIALCRVYTNALHNEESGYPNDIHPWRSKYHSDGEISFGGEWFLLGIGQRKGEQITYHIPISEWNKTDFAKTLDRAPEFDEHTPKDVLERLQTLF